MTKASERETVKVEHVNGGAGFIMKEALITGEGAGRALQDVQSRDHKAGL